MPYGNFVGYEPAGDGALDFTTKDGKKLRLVGGAAEELRRKVDVAAFGAPAPQNVTPVKPPAAPPPEYSPPNTTALTGWLRNEPKPDTEAPAEPTPEEKQAALMSWIRGDEPVPLKSGNDPRVPEKFRTFEPPQVRPGRTFARAAAEAALDAAALPVKAASRAADYFTGNDSTFSNISGKDAAESLEYLYDKTEPAQIRREEQFAEGEIPQAQAAGKFAGEYTGGAPLAALTGRVPAFGAVLNATKKPRVKPVSVLDPKRHEDASREVFGAAVPYDENAALTGVYDKLGKKPSVSVYSTSSAPGEYSSPKDKAAGKTIKYVVRYHASSDDPEFDTEIRRTFTRNNSGLSVSHDLFTLPKEQQGKGIGKEILKNQVEKYDELGVKQITLDAAWSGRAVWPRMGFELSEPGQFPALKAQAEKFAGRTIDASDIHELSLDPSGRAFLSGDPDKTGAPRIIPMKADLQGASGERLRHYLGVK